jgi:ABC-type multidrug transport system fused ATPase/permease subunit
MFNFKKVLYYLSVYKKYIGSRLYLVFILAGLAAFTEGFGISLLLPLVGLTEIGIAPSSPDSQTGAEAFLREILVFFNIEQSLVGILAFIGMVFLIKGGITFASNAYQSHLKAQLLYEIKSMVYENYSRMTYEYYTKYNTGHFVNIINGQVGNLVASFDNYKQFLTTSVTTIAYLITAALIAPKFAAMAVVAGISLLLLFKGLNSYVHKLSRKTAQEQGDLNKLLVQTIQSLKYLISTNQLKYLRTGVLESIERLSGYIRIQGIAQSFTTAISEPISIVFILVVIIIQVDVFNAPLAPIFVALILFNRAMGSILGIQSAWQTTMSKIGSLEIVEKEIERLEANREKNGPTAVGSFSEEIVLQDVSYRYAKELGFALEEISPTVKANSTVAFVGESGAGKSTLVDMLTLLLKPHCGFLTIDGITWENLNLGSWRKQIGYVSQETVVFDDTVANNISLWRGDYNHDEVVREKVEQVAERAYAIHFINDLPDKFNTVVGDRGVRLSGGQRQRLFLARELFKDPRLLILDEATSALDSESERFIQESIERLRGKTTVVLIAHRLSTIKNADYIYVLQKGRIIEHGAYEDLMKLDNGRFSRMVELQSL